jgi:hypothetical protein
MDIEMEKGNEKNNILDIEKLINQYSIKFKRLLEYEKEIYAYEKLEEVTTITRLVDDDFFDIGNGNMNICDYEKKIFYKEFKDIYVIFNDIENSTKILEYCEKNNLLCIYIGYIKYTSELLSEILNYFNGRMIEITGDGNYSIIENLNKIKWYDLIKFNLNYLKNNVYYFYRKYCIICSKPSWEDIEKIKYFEGEESIVSLLRIIFYIFNREINNLLKNMNIAICFNMRFGCKYGDCKITRFQIKNHVVQDKLIGRIVNKAAHQAQRKGI